MTDSNRPQSEFRTFIWAIVLGFVAFVCGVMGQSLLLAKMDNAAPVLGVIVGPIGLVVGAILGDLSTRYHLSRKQNLLSLVVAVVIVSVGTVYMAVGEFDPTIRLIDAEIVGCREVDKLLASQTQRWSEAPAVIRAIKERYKDARPNWLQEIPDMVRAEPGAVLTIRIYQEAWVREQKWRWGGISKKVDSWKHINETKQVFAPVADPAPNSVCEAFTIGERKFSSEAWETSNSTPPDKLSSFLWLSVFQQVPAEYVRYIPRTK